MEKTEGQRRSDGTCATPPRVWRRAKGYSTWLAMCQLLSPPTVPVVAVSRRKISATQNLCRGSDSAVAAPALLSFYPLYPLFTIHAPRQTAQKIHGNTMEPAVNPQGNFRFSTTLLFLYQGMGILSTFPPVSEIYFGFSAILPKFLNLVIMKSPK